jgi:hypothetical protein
VGYVGDDVRGVRHASGENPADEVRGCCMPQSEITIVDRVFEGVFESEGVFELARAYVSEEHQK